jgi:hypothetical protein
MMWAAKKPAPPPRFGDKRTVRRFALFPRLVDLDDDPPVRVWLEWYYVYQELTHSGYGYGWQTLARYSGMPV